MKKNLLSYLLFINILCLSITLQAKESNVSKTFITDPFKKIYIAGRADVILTPSTDYEVIVEADSSVFNNIQVKVKKQKLTIHHYVTSRSSLLNFTNLDQSEEIKIYIKTPTLTFLDCKDYVDLTGGPFSSKEFVLNLTGFCSINLAIDCHQLSVSSEGSNSITIHGKSHIQKLLLEGLSQYDAKLLQTDKAFITMRDSSEATLHINDTLYADIQNKAELEYSGNPNKVEIQRKNSAHVKHIE